MSGAAREARTFGHAEVFALLGAASFAAARFLPLLGVPYVCPLKALTGLPCATCGMTHAFVGLAQGHLAAAFQASPLGALLALGAWTFAVVDAVRLAAGAPFPALPARGARSLAAAAVVAVVVNWGWLVLREVTR